MGISHELKTVCKPQGTPNIKCAKCGVPSTHAEPPLLGTEEWPKPPGPGDPQWYSRGCGKQGAWSPLCRAQQGATYTAPGRRLPRSLICWRWPSVPTPASQRGLTSPLPGCAAWGGAKRRLEKAPGARRPPASALREESWATPHGKYNHQQSDAAASATSAGSLRFRGKTAHDVWSGTFTVAQNQGCSLWRSIRRHPRKPHRLLLFHSLLLAYKNSRIAENSRANSASLSGINLVTQHSPHARVST